MSDIRILPLVPLKNTVIFSHSRLSCKCGSRAYCTCRRCSFGESGELAVFALKDAEVDNHSKKNYLRLVRWFELLRMFVYLKETFCDFGRGESFTTCLNSLRKMVFYLEK